MHPLIARFLDFSITTEVLNAAEVAQDDADAMALRLAATRFPHIRTALLKARGAKTPSPEVQQQLIVLCTRAAVVRLGDDPVMAPKIAMARTALQGEGATEAEADNLVAQAVLEEAFGYAGDPGEFDTAYLTETLESWPVLSKVTQETVDEWLETFSKAGAQTERPLRLAIAERILECAWNEGPEPITPEHIDDALDHIAEGVAASEFEKASHLMVDFLAFLKERQAVGPLRAARLTQLLQSAAAVGPLHEEDEADDDDETI